MEPSSTAEITTRNGHGKALKEAEISFSQCAILVFGKDAAPPFYFDFINQERKDSLALDISLNLITAEEVKLSRSDFTASRYNDDIVNYSSKSITEPPAF